MPLCPFRGACLPRLALGCPPHSSPILPIMGSPRGAACVANDPMSTFPPSSLPSCRHLKEISELQSQQKQEIEALYRRLGKPLPPNLGLFHTAPPAGRRRKTSKSKLKAGKLLNPLVQQLKVVASSTGWPSPSWLARGRAGDWRGAGQLQAGAAQTWKRRLGSPFTGARKPLQSTEGQGLCPPMPRGKD